MTFYKTIKELNSILIISVKLEDCFRYNVKMTSSALKTVDTVESVKDCIDLCRVRTDCKVASYLNTTYTCVLQGEGGQAVKSDAWTTVNMSCLNQFEGTFIQRYILIFPKLHCVFTFSRLRPLGAPYKL